MDAEPTMYFVIIDWEGKHICYKKRNGTEIKNSTIFRTDNHVYPLIPIEDIDVASNCGMELISIDLPMDDPDFCMTRMKYHDILPEDGMYCANKVIFKEKYSLADVTTYTKFGISYPTLITAVNRNFIELSKFLMKNFPPHQSIIDYALEFFIMKRNFSMVKFFIKYGAVINCNTIKIATYCSDNFEIFTYLFENGGDGVIMKNIDVVFAENIVHGNLQVVKFLVENGANLYADYFLDGLNVSIMWNRYEIAKYLLEIGTNLNFEHAALHGKNGCRLHYLKLLIQYGCCCDFSSLLILASFYGYLDTVKFLVENGADVHMDNDKAFRNAVIRSNLDVAEYLIQFGMDIHMDDEYLLRKSIENGDTHMITFLVDNGANIHHSHPVITGWYKNNY